MEQLLAILSDLRPDVDFAGSARLIDDGILDSFDIVSLVSELNDAFDVDINVSHLVPENFNSPDAMLALVRRLADEK